MNCVRLVKVSAGNLGSRVEDRERERSVVAT
jgi:hypothetical protein